MESDDLDALLRRLREEPDRLEKLRRLLVGETLDATASSVHELAEAQRRTGAQLEALVGAQRGTEERLGALTLRVDALTGRVDALTQRVDALTQRVDALTQRVDALTQRVDALTQRVDALAEQVGELVEQMSLLVRRVGKLEETTGWLVGDAMERRYRERGPVYFRAIARRLRTLEVHEVDQLLDEAVDAGSMSEADADQVRLADAILRGRRREDAASVYIVLEASSGVGLDDVQRAHDRAALLSRTGTPSIPVVAGQWVTDLAAEAARGMGVWQVTDGKAEAPEPGPRPL